MSIWIVVARAVLGAQPCCRGGSIIEIQKRVQLGGASIAAVGQLTGLSAVAQPPTQERLYLAKGHNCKKNNRNTVSPWNSGGSEASQLVGRRAGSSDSPLQFTEVHKVLLPQPSLP